MGENIKDIIKKEYIRCATDPEYFIRRYVYIQHATRGRMLFDMYPYQVKCLHAFRTEPNSIVLKARQIGISTLVSALAVWEMLFHTDRNIVIIATKQETAKNLITKIRFAYENLPVWLAPNCIENNKLSLRFSNGSAVKATTSSKDAGRSEAVSLLIIDEAAFIRNANDIWTSAQATLATGGRSVVISTPYGIGNFFHKTWVSAENGDNNFCAIKLDWRVHPDRNDEWRLRQTEIIGNEKQAAQEYDAEFLGSGNTVVDEYLIQFYEQTYQQDPQYKTEIDNNFWVWETPDYNKKYIVCADVSRGDQLDKSTCHVLDAETCVQVAEYRGDLGTTEFGHMLVSIATRYNDAILVIENSNIGWSTVQTVIDRGYKNLFYMSQDLRYVDMESQVMTKYYGDQKKAVPGFTTSTRTRPLIVSKLQQYMNEKSVIIRSERTLNELKTFIWKNGKPEAQEGYFDDLVMALAIGLWVRDTALRLFTENQELTRQTLDQIKIVRSLDTPGSNIPLNQFPQTAHPYHLPIYTSNNMETQPDRDLGDLRQWL